MLWNRRKGDATPEVELPVTPMLDMTFQLLTFFIFTYRPSGLEGQMDFSLPASGQARAPSMEQVNPEALSEPELALKAQVTVLLKSQKDGINDGLISTIIVQTPQGEQTVGNLDALARYLKDKRASQDLASRDDIQIQAESQVKYACVMETMDTCVKAGFQRVGFAAPPDAASIR